MVFRFIFCFVLCLSYVKAETNSRSNLLDSIAKSKSAHARSLKILENIDHAKTLATKNPEQAIAYLENIMAFLKVERDAHMIILSLQHWWVIDANKAYPKVCSYLGHTQPVIRGGISRLLKQCSKEQQQDLLQRYMRAEALKQAHILKILSSNSPQLAKSLVTNALGADQQALRFAALFSAQQIKSADLNIPLLKSINHADEEVRELSYRILEAQKSPQLAELIAKQYPSVNMYQSKVLYLKLLASIGDVRHRHIAIQALDDRFDDVRKAASEALSRLGHQDNIQVLVQRILQNPSNAERRSYQKALIAAGMAAPSQLDWQKALIASLTKAKKKPRKSLLIVMGQVATPIFVDQLSIYLYGEDKSLARESLRALAASNSANALPALSSVLNSKLSDSNKVLAIRGMTRLIQQLKLKPEEKIKQLQTIHPLSPREVEKDFIEAAIKRLQATL